MKKSKRINRNLAFIGIIILGVLVYVFGASVYEGLNTVSPWKDEPQKVFSVSECVWSWVYTISSFCALTRFFLHWFHIMTYYSVSDKSDQTKRFNQLVWS